MLLATKLERIFIIKDKGEEIRLSDPEPTWDEEMVLNYYAPTYPILTTATISIPRIENDNALIEFTSVMGTKG